MSTFWQKLTSCRCCEKPPPPLPPIKGLPDTGLKMKTMDGDWMISANQEAHHTGDYENDLLVLRRGQTFTMKATFQRRLSPVFDQIFLEFTTGPNPQFINNTKIRCPLVAELESDIWGMKVVKEEEKEVEEIGKSAEDGGEVLIKKTLLIVTFEVNIPPKTVIGKYESFIEFRTRLKDGTISKSRDHEPSFYIIFNPWCVDDEVYLESEEEREEYCLADTGIIYRGSSWRISPKYWNFGQFEAKILDCAIYLLDKDKRMRKNPNKWMSRRGNAVWVSRVIPYMINECVLRGEWGDDYSGGTSPLAWNGSVKILTEYFETQRMVKFGQCWVFSGVTTSALRALGIPTRCVTNFDSAHDTEGSMTIDRYLDEDGEEVDGITGDMTWNFHVWNESWMKRSDLPPGYDGWQVVDATPQEESHGLRQTGPAPTAAIKNGEVYLGFETGFVFAEVNADSVTWIVKKDRNNGNYVVVKKAAHYKRDVGKSISTKNVGWNTRNDITDTYKFKEGSEQEREAFNKAYSFGSAKDYHKGFLNVKEEGEGITIDIDDIGQTFHGNDIKTKVNLRNDTDDPVTVDVTVVLYSTTYTRERYRFIKRIKYTDVKVKGKAKVTQAFQAGFKDYFGKMCDGQYFHLTVTAKVKETNDIFVDGVNFYLENKDTVSIEVEEEEMVIGRTYTVKVKLENPLPVRMGGIEITLEGPGLSYPVTKSIGRTLAAGEIIEKEFEVKPKKIGRRTLLVDVDSKQIKDLKASKKIAVIR